jgi:isochorismate synthase
MLASLRDVARGQRVALGQARPAFAMSRFANFSGTDCDLVLADIVLDESGVRYVGQDGSSSAEPASTAQQRLTERLGEGGPARLGPDAPLFDGIAVPAIATQEHYTGFVSRAVAAIRAGEFQKVVASRAEARPLGPDFDALALFGALAGRYPSAFVCLVAMPGLGVWCVATPETLLRVDRDGLTTMSLAGTQPIGPEARVEDVTWGGKFVEEQGLVTRYIRRALAGCGLHEVQEAGPRTIRAGNLAHLCTTFHVPASGDLPARATQLLGSLHPTSAVCGMPREPAQRFIAAHEGYDRSYYAGYLGPVGFESGSELYVNLRTAQLIGDTAYLYVGAGITAESSPEDEWRETIEKTKTLGAAFAAL